MIKRYVDKRSREATQAQVTVTPDDAVQHCSPCLPNPDMPSDVCFKLKSIEGKMDPERGELESPSAGTRLKNARTAVSPERGDVGSRTNHAAGFLTAGVGSSQGGNISSPTERAKNTATLADISSSTEHVGTLAGTAATPEKRRAQDI